MNDPEFLDLEDVLLIHREQLGRFGGGDGLRDQGPLESAIAGHRLDKAGLAALLERLSRPVGGEGAPRKLDQPMWGADARPLEALLSCPV